MQGIGRETESSDILVAFAHGRGCSQAAGRTVRSIDKGVANIRHMSGVFSPVKSSTSSQGSSYKLLDLLRVDIPRSLRSNEHNICRPLVNT